MSIGVIQVQRVLDESARGKGLSARLRGVADKWQQEIAAVDAKLQIARERLQKPTPGAPPEVAFRLQREHRLLELEMQSLIERQRFDVEVHRAHFREQLLADMREVAAVLASEQKLSAIVAGTPDELTYASPEADLTALVMQRLDAKSK